MTGRATSSRGNSIAAVLPHDAKNNAGTDTMIALNLQAEISSYVNVGFTPFKALQIATVNTAKAQRKP